MREITLKEMPAPLEGLAPLSEGLGSGELGVVMARAGVGKTAFLIQMALGELLRGREVIHIALGQRMEQVQSSYLTLWAELAGATGLDGTEAFRRDLFRRRAIQAYAETDLTPGKLKEALEILHNHLGLKPQMILIDGFDWSTKPRLASFKEVVSAAGATLLFSAKTHREESGRHPTTLPSPLADHEADVDLAVFLEPEGARVKVRLLKGPGHAHLTDPLLWLEPITLMPVGSRPSRPGQSPLGYTLLSGAAEGAEAEFGACAERWGVRERNFTFAGRAVARQRGLVVLNQEDLNQGDVSWTYLKAHMQRAYPETLGFRKILQSIWHQVNLALEVFSVGVIQPEGTVKGGTGWAVELAKHQRKAVFVYDQDRQGWFCWQDNAWQPVEAPVIHHPHFAGTGTRHLNDEGRQAIQDLFERSFR